PGTKATKWPTTPASPKPPTSLSTSATHTHPGSGAPTKTPTHPCASTSPKAPTYHNGDPATSTTSPPNSTTAPANATTGKPPPKSSINYSHNTTTHPVLQPPPGSALDSSAQCRARCGGVQKSALGAEAWVAREAERRRSQRSRSGAGQVW